MAVIPAGYQISAVVNQGNTYPDLSSAMTAQPNYTAGAGDNDFTLVLTFSGALTLSVPDTIDFGLHNVTSQTQNLKGSLDKALTVTDSRNSATITNWSLSVQESSPIQEVDSSGNPVAGGVSFEGGLYFGGNQMMLGKMIMVHSEYSLTTGTFDISSSWTGQQGFWLTATVAQQKAGTNFQGALTWTLSQTP